MTTRPALLFYCQHSVGMGHLVRSLGLAGALAAHFDVVLLSGGTLPAGMGVPRGVRAVQLHPLGHSDDYSLISRDERWTVEQAQQLRVERILHELRTTAPAAVVLELFPFGRRKFAFELLPLLEEASSGPARPLLVSSLRDLLVSSRRDQARHDEQASRIANRFLDAVLVHCEPEFARLEESFRPATPLAVPVHYTGFVSRAFGRPRHQVAPAEPRVCVSAGGGLVGKPLFSAAVAAAPALHAELGLVTRIITGPFLPPDARAAVAEAQARTPWCLEVLDFVDELADEMAASAVSVSQCGYNTTMDLLAAGTPAVVVPYAEGREDEQTRRARRLETMGLVTVLADSELSPQTLVGAVRAALASGPPAMARLRMDGAERTADLLAGMAGLATGAVAGAGDRT